MGRFSVGEDSPVAYVVALICCHEVREGVPGVKSLLTTFESMAALELPIRLPPFFIFVTIGRGTSDENQFFLGIIAPNGEIVLKCGFGLKSGWGKDERTHDFVIRAEDISFPVAGRYVVRVFAQEERTLMERCIEVRIISEPPPESTHLEIE